MNITFKGSPNCDSNRTPVDRIIMHWFGVGTLDSANSRFQNPATQVSAHYGISDDIVWQWVKEEDVAYHAGNYAMNQRSIGIEHDATTTTPASEKTYQTSATLVADICKKWDIPCDRTHILKHSQVVATSCCGTLDIDKIILKAQSILATPDPVANLAEELSALKIKFNLLQVKYNELQDKYTKDMAQNQLQIETMQKTSAEMTSQLTLAGQRVESAVKELELKAEEYSALQDQLADFMEENDLLHAQISNLNEIINKRDLEIVELKKKLKEGLSGYTKWQLVVQLFRR
jgi:hypothetical protein